MPAGWMHSLARTRHLMFTAFPREFTREPRRTNRLPACTGGAGRDRCSIWGRQPNRQDPTSEEQGAEHMAAHRKINIRVISAVAGIGAVLALGWLSIGTGGQSTPLALHSPPPPPTVGSEAMTLGATTTIETLAPDN